MATYHRCKSYSLCLNQPQLSLRIPHYTLYIKITVYEVITDIVASTILAACVIFMTFYLVSLNKNVQEYLLYWTTIPHNWAHDEFTKYHLDWSVLPTTFQLHKSEHHLDGPLYWSKKCVQVRVENTMVRILQFIVYHGRILKKLINNSTL
jgi:hypothetical protein